VYGGFYAILRVLAKPAAPGLILDDMFQALSILRQGYRCVIDRSALASDVSPPSCVSEFRSKVRAVAGNFQLAVEVPWILSSANRLLFQLVSHNLLRLLVPYFFVLFLISAAVLGTHSMVYLAFSLLQAAFWLLATMSLKVSVRIPVLKRLAAAAVVGLFTFLSTRDPLWKIWTPTTVSPFEEKVWSDQRSA
jgi:poly-beta-1,6-N-acetyl-D-glucosamine synthase